MNPDPGTHVHHFRKEEFFSLFFSHAEAGDHVEAGFADFAYGMSKAGLWKATAILAEQYSKDPRRILINSASERSK